MSPVSFKSKGPKLDTNNKHCLLKLNIKKTEIFGDNTEKIYVNINKHT